MSHNLFPLPDGRFYCGPSAIASFTGLHPKDDLREIINEIRGFRDSQGVIGMSHDLVEKVLTKIGIQHAGFKAIEPREVLNGMVRGHHYHNWRVMPTLQQFAEANQGDFIVACSRHYIALSNGYAQDSKSGAPYRVDRFSGARSKVREVLKIERPAT